MRFLMEVRLDEGLLGDDAIRARLDEWWARAQHPQLTGAPRRTVGWWSRRLTGRFEDGG